MFQICISSSHTIWTACHLLFTEAVCALDLQVWFGVCWAKPSIVLSLSFLSLYLSSLSTSSLSTRFFSLYLSSLSTLFISLNLLFLLYSSLSTSLLSLPLHPLLLLSSLSTSLLSQPLLSLLYSSLSTSLSIPLFSA